MTSSRIRTGVSAMSLAHTVRPSMSAFSFSSELTETPCCGAISRSVSSSTAVWIS